MEKIPPKCKLLNFPFAREISKYQKSHFQLNPGMSCLWHLSFASCWLATLQAKMALTGPRFRVSSAVILLVFLICSHNNARGNINTGVHRRFEYKYSFKPPYLAQKDGTVPFWEYGGSKYTSESICWNLFNSSNPPLGKLVWARWKQLDCVQDSMCTIFWHAYVFWKVKNYASFGCVLRPEICWCSQAGRVRFSSSSKPWRTNNWLASRTK